MVGLYDMFRQGVRNRYSPISKISAVMMGTGFSHSATISTQELSIIAWMML